MRDKRVLAARMSDEDPDGRAAEPYGPPHPKVVRTRRGSAPGGLSGRAQAPSRKARRTQMSPMEATVFFSSTSSATEASILARDKSSISRPWTIFHSPFSEVQGKEEMMPSGTP